MANICYGIPREDPATPESQPEEITGPMTGPDFTQPAAEKDDINA